MLSFCTKKCNQHAKEINAKQPKVYGVTANANFSKNDDASAIAPTKSLRCQFKPSRGEHMLISRHGLYNFKINVLVFVLLRERTTKILQKGQIEFKSIINKSLG